MHEVRLADPDSALVTDASVSALHRCASYKRGSTRTSTIMRTFAVPVLLVVSILSSCAQPRSYLHTKSSDGRVTSIRPHAETPAWGPAGVIAVPVGRGSMPVDVTPLPIARPTYIYDVRLTDGQLVQTQSDRNFSVGDCVRLWHGNTVSGGNDQYNFVAGTLEPDDQCPNGKP